MRAPRREDTGVATLGLARVEPHHLPLPVNMILVLGTPANRGLREIHVVPPQRRNRAQAPPGAPCQDDQRVQHLMRHGAVTRMDRRCSDTPPPTSLHELSASRGIHFARLLHPRANETLEVLIGRYWKVLWSSHGHTPPSGERSRRPNAQRKRPGSVAPFSSQDPRWGGSQEAGRGSSRP